MSVFKDRLVTAMQEKRVSDFAKVTERINKIIVDILSGIDERALDQWLDESIIQRRFQFSGADSVPGNVPTKESQASNTIRVGKVIKRQAVIEDLNGEVKTLGGELTLDYGIHDHQIYGSIDVAGKFGLIGYEHFADRSTASGFAAIDISPASEILKDRFTNIEFGLRDSGIVITFEMV